MVDWFHNLEKGLDIWLRVVQLLEVGFQGLLTVYLQQVQLEVVAVNV